ncbi:MAG: M23 family metallopeptidase [Pseudomonadota bacterium]
MKVVSCKLFQSVLPPLVLILSVTLACDDRFQAQASPEVEYGNVGIDIEGTDACQSDDIYETMKTMVGWIPPLSLEVRGISVRIPYRAEENRQVGSYGDTRNEGAKFHAGTDLLAEEGEDVLAVASGKVIAATASSGAFGTYVVLRVPIIVPPARPCAVDFYYAHLSQVTVKTGEDVVSGQALGKVGRSGNVSTNIPTHLHIEMWLGKYASSLDVRKQKTRDIIPLFGWF